MSDNTDAERVALENEIDRLRGVIAETRAYIDGSIYGFDGYELVSGGCVRFILDKAVQS